MSRYLITVAWKRAFREFHGLLANTLGSIALNLRKTTSVFKAAHQMNQVCSELVANERDRSAVCHGGKRVVASGLLRVWQL